MPNEMWKRGKILNSLICFVVVSLYQRLCEYGVYANDLNGVSVAHRLSIYFQMICFVYVTYDLPSSSLHRLHAALFWLLLCAVAAAAGVFWRRQVLLGVSNCLKCCSDRHLNPLTIDIMRSSINFQSRKLNEICVYKLEIDRFNNKQGKY